MVYNKTKRGLEKAAGITGVVIGSLEIFSSIIMFGMSLGYFYYVNAVLFSMSIIMFVFSIIKLIFCALIIKSPVDVNGNVQSRTGLQICVIIFSLLAGNLVVFGLEIAVVCMKDLVPSNGQQQNIDVQAQSVKLDSIESKINELKRLKELGIVDDDTYKNALEKIINDLK